MSSLAIISLLAGAVLGGRLKVLALVPIIGIGLATVLAVAWTVGASWSSTGTATALVAGGLQLGYVAGVLSHHMLAVARASRLRVGASAPTAARTSP
jgi:hypothetical protein